jgi:hypothetical protein
LPQVRASENLGQTPGLQQQTTVRPPSPSVKSVKSVVKNQSFDCVSKTMIRHFALLLGFLSAGVSVEAQSVTNPGPAATVPMPAAAGNTSNSLISSGGNLNLQPSPFQWGAIEFRPSMTNRFVYSDGILAEPGHPANSYINTLSPGFQFAVGSHWLLNYTPTWTVYTSHEFHNSFNHAFSLSGAYTSQNWSLAFTQSYSKSSDTLIETARQTKQQVSSTSLNVGYRFTDKLRLDSSNSQNLNFIEAAPDTFEWSTQNWLDYAVSSRLNLALGAGAGYVQIYHSSDMYYLRPGARITLKATDKLSLSVDGGEESRTFLGHGSRTMKSPTLNASINYQPFEPTTLSFTYGRDVTVSYFAGAVTQNQRWSIGLQQRLLKHFTLSADVSGGKVHYVSSVTVFDPNATVQDILDADGNIIGQQTTVTYTSHSVIVLRDDNQRAADLKLSTTFLRHGTITALYQYTRNDSSVAGYRFTSHQIGCEIGYRF